MGDLQRSGHLGAEASPADRGFTEDQGEVLLWNRRRGGYPTQGDSRATDQRDATRQAFAGIPNTRTLFRIRLPKRSHVFAETRRMAPAFVSGPCGSSWGCGSGGQGSRALVRPEGRFEDQPTQARRGGGTEKPGRGKGPEELDDWQEPPGIPPLGFIKGKKRPSFLPTTDQRQVVGRNPGDEATGLAKKTRAAFEVRKPARHQREAKHDLRPAPRGDPPISFKSTGPKGKGTHKR